MAVTINIIGDLINDQTSGLQDDDVNVDVSGTSLTSADLNALFVTFLNTLNLTAGQKTYAADVEAASQAGLVQVTASAGEIIGNLVLSDQAGAPLDGDIVAGMTTLDGQALHLWSDLNGKAVLVKADDGHVVAAIYLAAGANNLSGDVQVITFESIKHPDTNNDDDRLNFTDVLRVAATFTTPIGGQIGVDDDGPSIAISGNDPDLTTDDTDLVDTDSANYTGAFASAFGTDGAGTTGGLAYELNTTGGNSGLIATVSGEAITLSKEAVTGDIVGRITTGSAEAIRVHVAADGTVTLTQTLAIVHTPDSGPDQFTQMSAANLVTLSATITDADGDHKTATANIADDLFFKDDAPTIQTQGTEPVVVVDETNLHTTDTKNFAGNFLADFNNDGAGSPAGTTYELSFAAGATGLIDSVNNEAVSLSKNAVTGDIEGKNTDGQLMFTVHVAANGDVTLDQSRAVTHSPNVTANDTVQLASDDLIVLTATAHDGDGDAASAFINIGKNLTFTDDAPVIVSAIDYPGTQTELHVGNAAGQSQSGTFDYNIGHDTPLYDGADGIPNNADDESDFTALPVLTGTVDNSQNPGITGATVTANGDETASSASFNFTFGYDKDPITAGIQPGTAGGTLTIDKVANTFSVTMTDPIDGFSFDILHTNELLAKAPTGNTGHPPIVVEQLTENSDPNPFFVQFTANSTTQQIGFITNGTGADNQTGNTAWVPGEFVANSHPDWVSATQSTNGVAGDTIQKGELLTLRFFGENILGDVATGTEKIDPTTTADGIAIKFDGIGASEDLIVVLNLIDANGVETTRSLLVNNNDIIKGNANVPFPYNGEFTLDNNDGLLIIEGNDYKTALESFTIQGVQIMQSGNGLSGQAIDFNGVSGIAGGSALTPTVAWEGTDNDVLKIVDIGFIQSTVGTIDANLNLAFSLADSDGDTTATQNIAFNVSNDFIV